MFAIKVVIAALGVALLGLIIWAFQTADFGGSFAAILADPWGVVALGDLYLGFILLSAIIFVFEKSTPVALVWVISLFILGNVVGAAYMLFRGLRLARDRSRPDRESASA